MCRDTRKVGAWLTITVITVIVVALAIAAPSPAPAASRLSHHQPPQRTRCTHAGRTPSKVSLRFLSATMLCLVNRVRERSGAPLLRLSRDLQRSAAGHSNDMVRHRHFSHSGSHGSTILGRVSRTGYLSGAGLYFVGENIGGGRNRKSGSAIQVFRAWMHSPPHRANILDRRFRDAGVGVARGFPYGGGRRAATYTLDLGVRR